MEQVEEQYEISFEELRALFVENDLMRYLWSFALGFSHEVSYTLIRESIEYSLTFGCDGVFLHKETGTSILAKKGLRNVELVMDNLEKGIIHIYKLKEYGASN